MTAITRMNSSRAVQRTLPGVDETKGNRSTQKATEAKAPVQGNAPRIPQRLAYIEMVSGRARPSRSTQYAKLEVLLQQMAADAIPVQSAVSPWIKGTSRPLGDQSSSYAQLRASSAQTVQFSRRSVGVKKLNPLERSKSATDDLLVGTKLGSATPPAASSKSHAVESNTAVKPEPLKLGGKWKTYATHPLALASKGGSRTHVDHLIGDAEMKVMMEHPLASSALRGRILEWSQGIGWKTSSGGLPALGHSIWMSELQKQQEENAAATKIQKVWRGCRQARNFRTYRNGLMYRKQRQLKTLLSLWQRVGIQRPQARTPLSQTLINWRVEVCQMAIAREKAKDLKAVWETMVAMQHLRGWRSAATTLLSYRATVHRRVFTLWLDYSFSQKAWKLQNKKHAKKLLFHSYRAMYFWGCCAAKCRRRSYKLFRYEDATVDPLSAPVDRFKGYGKTFNCSNILEYFRFKDWYERRVIRCHYVRVMPKVVRSWRLSVEGGKKFRYAALYRVHVVCRKFFLLLKEGANVSSPNRDSSTGEGDEENEASKFTVDSGITLQDNLDREVGDLMKLVDHEQRELFRRKLKRDRKKLIVRVKLSSLQQENELLKKISAQHDQSTLSLDQFFFAKDEQAEVRAKEEQYVIEKMKMIEDEKWAETKNRFIKMVQKGIDILTNCLNQNEQEVGWYVFSECWRLLKKPCATTRMMRICRKIMHTAILTRLLSVCSWFVRMQKSIHRYRPLRIKLLVWRKLLKTAEHNYALVTPNLKAQICRRRVLSDRFSDIIYEWGLNRNLPSALPDRKQVFDRKDMVLGLWMEITQRDVTRREACWLFAKRRTIRKLYHSFTFLKDRVIRRQIVVKNLRKTFLESNVCEDILLWKRKFFTGMNHACYLRRLHRRLRQKAILKLKNGTNLPNLLASRRETLNRRCELEQCLLLRYCDVAFGKDDRKSEKRGMVELYTSQVPLSNFLVNFGEQSVLRYLGTVFSQRKSELVSLLTRCDSLAQRARNQFDNAQIGYAISNWLFKVRSYGLIKVGDKYLPRRRRFWKHVQDLFITAQTGRVSGEPS